ncbi:hypothetical protein EJ08DRAFT_401454 [Tothia fuscella]|uniref:Uncharacterized protein n=1 Tax=Tothia fuscella TaxID=1048955 RepID=A0A9P4NKH9_9PEZI|nr:hypothetical protein EJ08DRAFT_401454 [Tothia fuscella]
MTSMALVLYNRRAHPQPLGFLDLHRELRDTVYKLICSWDDIESYGLYLLEGLQAHRRMENMTRQAPAKMGTPGLLLINRQIHNEALQYLTRTPLKFSRMPEYSMNMGPVMLSELITPQLLLKVQVVELHIPRDTVLLQKKDISLYWHKMLRNILFWMDPRTHESSLQKLRIRVGEEPIVELNPLDDVEVPHLGKVTVSEVLKAMTRTHDYDICPGVLEFVEVLKMFFCMILLWAG